MVSEIAEAAGIPRHASPYVFRHAAITTAVDAGVPLRDAQILARHAHPRTTEPYDRARPVGVVVTYREGVVPLSAVRPCRPGQLGGSLTACTTACGREATSLSGRRPMVGAPTSPWPPRRRRRSSCVCSTRRATRTR